MAIVRKRGRFQAVPLKHRFWDKVATTENEDECWVWTANRDGGGYGLLTYQGSTIHAQRVSWMIHFGEIPDDLMVRHRCDNPPCVNPKHLLLGTHADNMMDVR